LRLSPRIAVQVPHAAALLPGGDYVASETCVCHSAGHPYPQISACSQPGFVPLPGPSYFSCDDPLFTRPCQELRTTVIKPSPTTTNRHGRYLGWVCSTLITIKPTSWGGGNSQSSLVLLDRNTEHPYLTTWWRSFSDPVT
jgi:hypothetical protein